jgi:hypothetical protein
MFAVTISLLFSSLLHLPDAVHVARFRLALCNIATDASHAHGFPTRKWISLAAHNDRR